MGKHLQKIKMLNLSVMLIRLGARVGMVRSHCGISLAAGKELTWEVLGRQPTKGLLPFSEEWFYNYRAGIHSMLFLSFYDNAKGKKTFRLVNAYKMYLKHLDEKRHSPLLDINRADLLINLINANVLQADVCEKCERKHVRFNANNKCRHCDRPPKAKELNIF